MSLFLTTFMTVFLAELGDKTQLAALAGASGQTRARKFIVFLAASAALSLTSVIAVAAGALLGRFLDDPRPIKLASGILFIAFGIAALRQRVDVDGAADPSSSRPVHGIAGLFVRVFMVVFLAELGDKTQLTTLGLSGPADGERIFILLGATAALIAATGVAVLLSNAVDRLLPPARRSRVTAIVFLLLGLWTLASAFRAS